jgi:magnesium-transporting ATPase (P-type)
MVNDKVETYKVLKVNEFTNERKRMSVVVQNKENGRIVSFVKGADESIIS